MRRLRARGQAPHPSTTSGATRLWPGLLGLAAICYLPLLLTAPGRLSADTKTYLYLDPGGLLARATAMWDAKIALGFVPHQQIGFLWPMGPFFWVLDALGLPDWVAQRLWWGSLLFAAGAGVAVLLRRFRWRPEAIWVGAAIYALSPYVLTLLARLSGVLLPYAALPWLVLLTFLAATSRGWRHPALFALVAATAGSVNLTALVLVGLAPLAVLAHLVGVAQEVRPRDALAAAARIGVLTVAVSAWWLVGLAVQASHGNDVLRYSETAEVVAEASTANEVLRGLGYWLFYGEDRVGPWIEPSIPYTQSPGLLAVTYLLPVLGLLGAAVARWRHRALFIALVGVGLVVSVGPFPWDDPPPLGQAIKALLLTERGLAMRSLPRAAPVMVLGLAVLAAAGVGAALARHRRVGRVLAAGTVVLAILALPPLWTRTLVPTNLDRPESLPEHWVDAAAHIDRAGTATRVLEIPGSDFGTYRWGNTVDPITPGLVERDVAYRELIPFGPPESARMLLAADQGLQDRVAEPEALAAVARLLRAGDLVVRGDLQFERFNVPRPRWVWNLVEDATGLGEPVGFGPGDPNRSDPAASLEDELFFLVEIQQDHPPEVAVVPVEDPVPLLAAHGTGSPVVLAGDAFGVVDAAGAGLIDGSELLRFSAGLSGGDLADALDDGAVLVVTDSNRARGQRWHTIRHTQGYTEPAGHEPLRTDHSDNRLPFFEDAGDDARTVAVHRGGITADATSYGNRATFNPEHRPANAVDGDPTTSWQTGGFADSRGERLEITLDDPVTADHVELLQPQGGASNRHLTEVRLRFDGGDALDVELGESSLVEPGQVVDFEERTFSTLSIEVVADSGGVRPRYLGQGSVGFAEVRIGSSPPTLEEWIRPPVDLLRATRAVADDHDLVLVLTRLRTDPTDVFRDDEERRLARLLELPRRRPFALEGTARVSARAPDHVLDAALGRDPAGAGLSVVSDGRLGGSRSGTGSDALDGDRSTAWRTLRGRPTGGSVTISSAEPITVDRLDLVLVHDGDHSVPTRLAVTADGGEPTVVDLPDPGEPGGDGLAEVPVGVDPPVQGTEVRVEILDARTVEVVDWISRAPVAQPVGIADLGIPGVALPPPPDDLDTGCRDDLVAIDGEPVPVRVTGDLDRARTGGALDLAACDGLLDLGRGELELLTADGAETGIDVDRLVLRSPADLDGLDGADGAGDADDADGTEPANGGLIAPGTDDPPTVDLVSRSATRWVGEVTGEPGSEAWVVLGQSFNDGWQARAGDVDLGAPELVDGFANGWRVPLGPDGTARVEMWFEPQRFVNLALAISVLAALACLTLAWRGRPALALADAGPEPVDAVLVNRYEGRLPTVRRAALVGVATALVAALIVPLWLAGVLGMLGGWACRHEQARGPLVLAGPVLAAVAGLMVLVQQVRHEVAPGIEWAVEHQRAHLVALVAVLVLALDAVVDRAWRRPETLERRRPRRRQRPR